MLPSYTIPLGEELEWNISGDVKTKIMHKLKKGTNRVDIVQNQIAKRVLPKYVANAVGMNREKLQERAYASKIMYDVSAMKMYPISIKDILNNIVKENKDITALEEKFKEGIVNYEENDRRALVNKTNYLLKKGVKRAHAVTNVVVRSMPGKWMKKLGIHPDKVQTAKDDAAQKYKEAAFNTYPVRISNIKNNIAKEIGQLAILRGKLYKYHPLPTGWTEHVDADTGIIKYKKNSKSQSQSERPAKPAEYLINRSHLPADWSEAFDVNTKQTYYQNNKTHATSWDRPS